jgi:hypothetical protein
MISCGTKKRWRRIKGFDSIGHPEGAPATEGSPLRLAEILRCAQNDTLRSE